jgi:N-methylhydantoinase A
VLSALGMLIAAPTKDYSQTVMVRTDDAKLQAEEWMRARFQALEERALREMLAEGHQAAALTFQHSLDMRYVGQSHELTIPCNGSEAQRAVDERFHRQHLSRYGYQQPREAVEIVNMRLAVTAPVTVPELSPEALETASADDARVGEKQVYFNQRPVATDLYERAKLRPGNKIDGPAIIFQYDTTTVLPPDWEATVDPFNNLILAQAE